MDTLARLCGEFLGTALGYTLKVAGPELEEFLARAIRRAISDSAELGKSDGPLDGVWNQKYSNPERRDGNSN